MIVAYFQDSKMQQTRNVSDIEHKNVVQEYVSY